MGVEMLRSKIRTKVGTNEMEKHMDPVARMSLNCVTQCIMIVRHDHPSRTSFCRSLYPLLKLAFDVSNQKMLSHNCGLFSSFNRILFSQIAISGADKLYQN